MHVAIAEEPRVLHTIPGRVRVHLPGWSGQRKHSIEILLREVPGVCSVQAKPLTGNILIYFDPLVTSEPTILTVVRTLDLDTSEPPEEEPPPPPVMVEKRGRTIRAHIAVRGLNRDPHLAKRVVEHLERQPGVRATVNQLTGRVLVEFTEHEADLDDLISQIVGLELPELPGEDRPAHPLDPAPLVQSAVRTGGATLGLGLLAARQATGIQEPLPGASGAIQVASVIGILQGIPLIRHGLRKLLGRTVADLLLSIPGIITLTLAGSVLGLAVAAAESLRMLTEVFARRQAWRRHEERAANEPSSRPDALIHLEAGGRIPLAARVLEGTGTAIGRDGLPRPVVPDGAVPPGARLYGGPFVLQLQSHETMQAFIPASRPAPVAPSFYDRYQQILSPLSLLYAGVTALFTRSFNQTLASLLLVNPRAATLGQECADFSAAARVLRAGVVVVGTRKDRPVRLPDFLLLDGVRPLTDGLELVSALPLTEEYDTTMLLALAAGVSSAAGSPWGGIFKSVGSVPATDGNFDGKSARAVVEGARYSLSPVEDWSFIPEASSLRQSGSYALALRNEREQRDLGIVALRPRLAPGVSELVQACRRYGVQPVVISDGYQIVAQTVAHRAGIPFLDGDHAIEIIRARQEEGARVAFISDNAAAAPAFEACDLAISVWNDHSYSGARADLLAPDLTAVAAIIEAGARQRATVRDSVGLSLVSNIIGAVWGFLGMPGVALASTTVYIAALAAIVDGWIRSQGGNRPASSVSSHLVDPHPERWGRLDVESVLQTLHSSEEGLSSAEAAIRRRLTSPQTQQTRRYRLLTTILDQARSPLIGMLAVGAGLSLFLGATADVAIIGLTILASVAMSAWQEHKANKVTEMLQSLGTSHARVLRDGYVVTISTDEVVPGDILLLASGDRVAADARIVNSRGLEVDEAALTGESLPVPKFAVAGTDTSRIILAGSNITTGTGRAVVVAVGRHTRMGATTEALAVDETEQNPLGVRLTRMLRVILPISIGGGVAVILAGLLWGQPLALQLATGATIALAGVPEGLPLLAKVGEAGVARRLASRYALVRRLSSVEALGRIDVACTDKTGTLTKGRLALSLVASMEHEARVPGKLPAHLRHVLLTAALACPPPDAPGARSHPTDIAVIQGALDAGLGDQLRVEHEAELPFDPMRSFHATLAQGVLCVKGAPETLLPRCDWMIWHGQKRPLDRNGRQEMLANARHLAEHGLRVLLVAEGSQDLSIDNPYGLTALGFVGISDPLRSTVQAAVRRCHNAGVRVIMITGDHPATARAIAHETGLLSTNGEVLTGAEMAELHNGELAERLEQTSVIARATPLDKLRIIECLRKLGHTVAMTGDGVNDAPALRLADVGIAMGDGSTEVARQTADVVITNDDFSTLVETFVEGRSFWRNIRRSLGLLLGGNLGELGLIVSASFLGLATPLTARQILAVNVITDILPAMAVALQRPEHRNLAELSREGAAALGGRLRYDMIRRATTSAAPSLASYLLMLPAGVPVARTAAFGSIVATQLAQTLDVGRSEGGLTPSVFGAVAGSASVFLIALTVPPVRDFLNLVALSPFGWALMAAGALGAVGLSHLLAYRNVVRPASLAL